MDIFPLLCVIAVTFTGLTKGAGVLPDGPLNAAVGETVMFTPTVTPSETPFLPVIWSFDDKNIITFSGSNITAPEYEGRITLFIYTGSLELRNLTRDDSGEYSIFILPAGELAKEGKTRLDVHVPVSDVMATASSTDLVEDSSVHLSCSSSGSSLSFLWFNGSSEVTASDRVQLTDGNSTLTVNVTRYDQGPFSCHVSNPVSDARSDPIHLFISYGPDNIYLTISPSQEYYEEGSNINLICSADSRPVAQYTWLLNGTLLSDTGPELRLMNIQESESGNYSCQAFNSKTLRSIKSQPAAISVLTGVANVMVTNTPDMLEFSTVRLSCSSSGSFLSFLWLNGSSEITESERVQLTDGGSTLTIVNVTRYDQGPFRCQVSNPVSNGTSGPVNLSINYGPEDINLTISPSQEHYDEGSDISLMCSAVSRPSALFQWFLNGTLLSDTGPELRLMNIQMSQSGSYSCQAFNSKTMRNEMSQPSVVSVLGLLPPPQGTLSAGAIVGIVIAVLVICGAVGGGGYYMYTKKKRTSKLSTPTTRNPTTGRGAEGQDNKAYTGGQELNYADISVFQNKNGGTVQLGLQSNSSEYAQIVVNNNPPAASSPPTYEAHQQRIKKPAPQPRSNATDVYAQVRKK